MEDLWHIVEFSFGTCGSFQGENQKMVGYTSLKIIVGAAVVGLGDVSTLVVVKTLTVSR